MLKIGILALQGAIREHRRQIEATGCEAIPVQSVSDLAELDGLVLPGGESTTISKLLHQYGLMEPIRTMADNGVPMFGTCAGLILLAKQIAGYEKAHLGLMDVTVERNSFGRQTDSFETALTVTYQSEPVPAVFIRAPHMTAAGAGVEILATYEDRIVLARDRQFLGCSFHPELTEDTSIMDYFIKMVTESKTMKMKPL